MAGAKRRPHKCQLRREVAQCGQQVPRIAGQREDYLQMTLRGFKSGERPGNTMAMGEAVNRVTPDELDTLAYYAARFPGAVAASDK